MRDPSTSSFITGATLAELLEQLSRVNQALGYTSGLNPAQWSALRYFSKAEEDDRTVTGFARHHMSSHGTASQTITALVRKQMLERKDVPNNRRTHRLVITAKGWDALKLDPVQQLTEALDSLPGQHKQVLANALQDVLEKMKDDQQVAAE